MSSRPTFIGAVDIGTSKVTVLVAEYTGRDLGIIGSGECASSGITKGAVVDAKAASDCTHAALQQAERDAGEAIDLVFLAQTGSHLEGFYNEGTVSVRSADNIVGADDMQNVCEQARAKQLPAGRMVVHHIRRPFRIDGRLVPDTPAGCVGQRLEVGYWTVHGQEERVADGINVIRGFNLKVRELVLASLASGYMVTLPEQRQHGVLVLDLGAGTTDFVLYRDGAPHTTGVLPVGGGHLTSDLCLALRLSEAKAEKLKLRFGRANVVTRDKAQKVWLEGTYAIGDQQFPQHTIEQITAARTWELLEIVRKKLGNAFSPEMCPAGVVLTGGAAKLPGLAETAAKVFGVPAHLGEVPDWVIERFRDPGFHTSLGLVYYGVRQHAEKAAANRRPGLIDRFRRLIASS